MSARVHTRKKRQRGEKRKEKEKKSGRSERTAERDVKGERGTMTPVSGSFARLGYQPTLSLARNATPKDAEEPGERGASDPSDLEMLEFWTTPWRDHPPVIIPAKFSSLACHCCLQARRVRLREGFSPHETVGRGGDERSETRKKEEGKEGREEGRRKGGKRKKGRNESRAEKRRRIRGRGPGANRRPLERAGPHTAAQRRPRPFLFSFL